MVKLPVRPLYGGYTVVNSSRSLCAEQSCVLFGSFEFHSVFCLFFCFFVGFWWLLFFSGAGSCGVVLNISVGFDKSNLKVNVHFIVHVQTGWLTVLFVSQRVQHL